MPDLPPADSIQSKGFTLNGALAFIDHAYGVEQRERVVAALPPASRELVGTLILDSSWNPFQTQVDLYETIDRVLGRGDLELCWEIGRFTAERELSNIHKLLLKIAKLELWIRSAGALWSRYYTAGRLELESIEGERGVVCITEFNPVSKAFCFDFGGWLHRMLELNRRRNVRVEHTSCVLDGAPACRYEAVWRLPG